MSSSSDQHKYHEMIDHKLLPLLDLGLHVLILLLIFALFVITLERLWTLFVVDIFTRNVGFVISQILFIFILIELFTILYSYLSKHYIKVERVVEVGIISVVRELMFNLFEIDIARIYAFSALLLVFGMLFFIEKRYSNERNCY